MTQITGEIEAYKPKDYLAIDPGEVGMVDYELFVKKSINLYDYPMFQGEQYQNPRKSAALKGEIGVLMKDFAYITYDINQYSLSITKLSKFSAFIKTQKHSN